MKKIALIGITILTSLTLVACSNKNVSTKSSTPETSTTFSNTSTSNSKSSHYTSSTTTKESKNKKIKDKESVLKTFSQKSIYSVAKKIKPKMFGRVEKTNIASLKSISVTYTIKNKNHAMMYAQHDAKNLIKALISKIKSPQKTDAITIYFQYNFKNADKTMFRIILDHTSYNFLKDNDGDYTKLDSEYYLVQSDFEYV